MSRKETYPPLLQSSESERTKWGRAESRFERRAIEKTRGGASGTNQVRVCSGQNENRDGRMLGSNKPVTDPVNPDSDPDRPNRPELNSAEPDTCFVVLQLNALYGDKPSSVSLPIASFDICLFIFLDIDFGGRHRCFSLCWKTPGNQRVTNPVITRLTAGCGFARANRCLPDGSIHDH